MPAGTTTVLDAAPDLLDAGEREVHVGVLDLVEPLLVVATETAVCVCGHGRDAHEHYRRGKDCALCDCPRYRRRR
ncbi:hypothetical protein [Curtobacterium pusillum]|uniref:hypothetical protein n=1 Tax=Curtobacterium pusillum TaxID=69373 RepID=UPI0011A588DF|nr:hypothetical protein [Curtobacterium pusillum]